MAKGNLESILKHLERKEDENLLVGFDSHDDGAVYRVRPDTGIVTTLDFFPPMVEDPYLFGQIAAANAVSDVFAMGGRVLTGLNILCYPEDGDLNDLALILKGGSDKLQEAGGVLAGGHSVLDETVKYGMSITGVVDPDRIWHNNTPRPGDVLVLTKKLGTGLVLAASRVGDVSPTDFQEAVTGMTTLNKQSADLLRDLHPHAVSDITGFGLLVHLLEMVSDTCTARISGEKIPYFSGVPYYIEEFYLSGAAQRNRNAAAGKVRFEEDDFILEEILFDPQTSGGLLVSMDPADAQTFADRMREAGAGAWIIGSVEEKQDVPVIVEGRHDE